MASKQQLSDMLRSFLRNTYLWRNLLAIAAIASMMLPWVYLDGAQSSLSGAELIAYWLATGTERGDMLGESVLGAMALFLVPVAVAVLCALVFWRNWRGQDPLKLSVAAGLLPLLIVVFSGSITSSEHLIGGRIVFPQAGVILMFLCHGALVVHSLLRGP